MLLQLKTPPILEPVDLNEVKNHLRLDTAFEDTTLASFVMAARMHVENLCGPLITQTWDQFEQHFPSEFHWFEFRRSIWTDWDTVYMGGRRRDGNRYDFHLGKSRVQSILSITYTDSDGTIQTLDPSIYTLESWGEFHSRVILQRGKDWPSDRLARGNSVTIEFNCGYGDTPDDIPEPIRIAILLLAGNWYENREAVLTGPGSQMATLPFGVDALLANYRWEGF